MCVTTAKARLGDTIVYAGLAKRDGKTVHVLGYQNTVENLARTRAPAGRPLRGWGDLGREDEPGVGANAMILPIPAVAGSLSEANMVDTSDSPAILQDMARTVAKQFQRPSAGGRGLLGGTSKSVMLFDKGMYTVVLAESASSQEIAEALESVPQEKRPEISRVLLQAFAEWYPGWPLAICCFNGTKVERPDPLLWWYQPRHPEVVFFPALDSHTGGVPDLDANVARDHILVLGVSADFDRPASFVVPEWKSDGLPMTAIRGLMPSWIWGSVLYRSRTKNGDFIIPVDALNRPHLLTFNCWKPPGAS